MFYNIFCIFFNRRWIFRTRIKLFLFRQSLKRSAEPWTIGQVTIGQVILSYAALQTIAGAWTIE